MIRSLTNIVSLTTCAVFICTAQPLAFAQNGAVTHKTAPPESSFHSENGNFTLEALRQSKPVPWYDEEADPDAQFSFLDELLNEPLGAPAYSTSGLNEHDSVDQGSDAVEQGQESGSGTMFNVTPEQSNGVNFGSVDIGDNTYVNKETPLWKQFPWRAVGRLQSNTGWCSASVISKNDVIVTAAHCCYDRSTKKWSNNFTFYPAYRNGPSSYGSFGYSDVWVLNAWINQGGRQNDVCVLKLKTNAKGEKVSKNGWLGYTLNRPSVQHHFAFGYPSNLGNGNYKYECSAESYNNCGSSNTLAMGCNMKNGSSGGPWIHTFKKFEAGSTNFVNSVVSGYDSCTGSVGKSFNGARFTSNNIGTLCNAAGC